MSAVVKDISVEKPYNKNDNPEIDLIVKAEVHFAEGAQAQTFMRRLMQLILDFNAEYPLP